MVTRKTGIVNVQLVKGNFATRKHYHLKLSTYKKHMATREIEFLNFATHQLISLNLQFMKSNLQLVILFPTCKIDLQLYNS